MNVKRALVTAIAAAVLTLGVAQGTEASPILIEYQTVNLSGNLWEYRYRVSDHTFLTDGVPGPSDGDQGFAIFFDNLLYAALDPAPVPPNADWAPITGEPIDALNSPGYYDALALVTGASLADLFRVKFAWDGAGTPGSQPFELYQLDADLVPVVLATGQTIPFQVDPDPSAVPEPGTLLLFGTGIGALLARKRQRAVSERQVE